MRKKSTADAKTANEPKVGLFFVVNGKPCVDGLPWAEVPSLAGFRTSALGHPKFWERLQAGGMAPNDSPYEDCPRGRVNYEDASGRFTLFADRCIIRNKRLVSGIMSQLSLPRGTRILTDDHYRCAKCLGKKPTRKQEEKDWDF
jgi:hypothetical protein